MTWGSWSSSSPAPGLQQLGVANPGPRTANPVFWMSQLLPLLVLPWPWLCSRWGRPNTCLARLSNPRPPTSTPPPSPTTNYLRPTTHRHPDLQIHVCHTFRGRHSYSPRAEAKPFILHRGERTTTTIRATAGNLRLIAQFSFHDVK